MANVLLLVHRLPYPPNKGDKVRSFHLLKHLLAGHQVYLGTFVDDPEDEQHVDTLRAMCAGLHVARLHPSRAKLASLRGLLSGEALSLPYYRDAGLAQWVRELGASGKIDSVVVFSSSMAQYAELLPQLPMLVDFVDVDSAKWTDYGAAHAWPMSWLYRREGERLLAYESAVAAKARCSFFVTDKEVALFRRLSPQSAQAPVKALCNGVDAQFFEPAEGRESPYAAGETPVVFTGAMDYWPNVDAVQWFATEVLPRLRERRPQLRFHIVGRSPTPAVQALAGEHVNVTGTVPDVRPWLQHAAVVVAPLRLARGVQNKVLEAMAMARPVVAARSCVEALDVVEGRELIAAETTEDYVREVERLLDARAEAVAVGAAGRQRVLQSYAWTAQLSGLDSYLNRSPEEMAL
ncbi:TIGR03087 family PEP-CTERM/XrtA system glycosyltransferase [Pelomonas sp. SE-A7]|uniref:TIGR03087 family PEP-CTERM/XrtA system glycosyltransferase n=1 Tax=Pelomonas sp. SE-A7 TaxID=3054953 RepID=UPI00259CC801|nr:TIGR03087 family PEP-CTERM/XrtA system glycosyltransferase [Pelomonas sp. SE-A7]MDM4764875.1 TIGR03087 family PEP-CTERM/XrtA system glycosyltransferase [Pelomonas sp. SE-A7]